MKRDPVDMLLQLAFLEGLVHTRGAYEQRVRSRGYEHAALPHARQELLARLEAVLHPGGSVAEVPATIGSFLQSTRTASDLRPQEIYHRLGISANIYKMLERDRMLPLKLGVEVWRRFVDLFSLPVDEVIDMVRRTTQLVHYRPSFRSTLARYDSRKNAVMKSAAMEKAASELYLRASLPLSEKDEQQLERLRRALKKETGD